MQQAEKGRTKGLADICLFYEAVLRGYGRTFLLPGFLAGELHAPTRRASEI